MLWSVFCGPGLCISLLALASFQAANQFPKLVRKSSKFGRFFFGNLGGSRSTVWTDLCTLFPPLAGFQAADPSQNLSEKIMKLVD